MFNSRVLFFFTAISSVFAYLPSSTFQSPSFQSSRVSTPFKSTNNGNCKNYENQSQEGKRHSQVIMAASDYAEIYGKLFGTLNVDEEITIQPNGAIEAEATKMIVSREQVLEAQKVWADGVVKIGSLKNDRAACKEFASAFLDEVYGFDHGTVLFKPTKCADEQFRSTKAEAVSYFIAEEDAIYPEDKGFAITPWTQVDFSNSDIILEEGRAIAMGNYWFTDTAGNKAKVEYTFGYKLVNGKLVIDLHHSSFPYNPAPAPATEESSTCQVSMEKISREEVFQAQQIWGSGVVKIGSLKDDREACEAFTNEFLDEVYAFDQGSVNFKPTKCSVKQFRPTKAEALSYFIAGPQAVYEEDKGFAINPWTNVKFENTDIILEKGRAIAMGNYWFTQPDGSSAKVEYTFAYKKINGKLKIDLHHSSFPFAPDVAPEPATPKKVTTEEVLQAQKLWADGVVKIGSLKENRAECEEFASAFIDYVYAFDEGSVLFKPTKCSDVQFRPTKSEAASYFLGGSLQVYPEDNGFAVTPWTKVKFENSNILLEEGRAIATGNYWFTGTDGSETKVEYTFGYKVAKDGKLKIDLHHSSIPFNPVPANAAPAEESKELEDA